MYSLFEEENNQRNNAENAIFREKNLLIRKLKNNNSALTAKKQVKQHKNT